MKNRINVVLLFSAFLVLNACSKKNDPVPPVATATPSSQTISTGAITAISLSSDIVGTTFSWTVVQVGVTGATSGNGSTIAQTLVNSGSTPGTATYSITPMADGTPGASIIVVVTVNPPAKITFAANIKPLLTNSCTPCHLAGGVNPNKWDDYATAKAKISGILDRVQRAPGSVGFMPKVGTQLTAAQIALLNKWLSDGLLEN